MTKKKQTVRRSALSRSPDLWTNIQKGARDRIARAKKKEKRAIRRMFAHVLFPDVSQEE